MNFSRKTILVVGAALLAACGDKVTVQEYKPPTPPPKVNSVEVSPSSVTVNTGATVTFTAAVNADAGLATTVTWSASAGTVTSAGVFTAPATGNPGIAVCATSTVDTGKKGCAQVVVTAAPTTIPASVSIASITAANLNTPVNPAAVAGQIDVRLNVNPGNQTISKIVLVVGSVRADSQTFTAAQSAALRFAADEAVAAQTTFPQVLFSVNTAKFNATTGVPTWMNIAQGVSAQLYTSQGGSSTAATATAQTTLTFANANTYVLTTSAGSSATGANGYKYTSGSISASIIPVIYASGLSFNAGTITFGSAGCDVTGPRTIALAAGTAPAYTATFTNSTGASAATNFRNYELRTANGACPLATGEGFTVTATDNAGNQLFAAAAPANGAANTFRMDNVAPGAPTLVQNPGSRQNGWVNGAIGFTTTNASSATNGMVVDGAGDAGVGGRTRFVRIATSAAGLVDEALAAEASSSPTLPAPSASNTTYCAVFSAKDALGNESARPAAGAPCSPVAVASATALPASHTLLGVDIAPPTVAFSGGLASSARIATAAVGGEFQVTVLDTGLVGNSGMLSGAAVIGTISVRNAAGTNCVFPAAAGACGAAASVNAAPGFPLVPTAGAAALTAVTTTGYFTYVAIAQDAAGNQSGTVTRTVAHDDGTNAALNPTITTASYASPITGGSTAVLTATASDNFDLRDGTWILNFAGLTAGGGAFLQPTVTINSFNAASLVNTSVPVSLTLTNFIRQIEEMGPGIAVVGGNILGTFAPTNVTATVRDVVNVTSAVATTPLTVTAAAPAFTWTAMAAGQQIANWSVTNGVANVWNGTAGGPTVAGTPSTRTLTAVATGPTATMNAPFARVVFYRISGGQLVPIGTATTPSLTDDGATRTYTYSLSFDATGIAAGAQTIYALGVNATGDAILTIANGNITVIN